MSTPVCRVCLGSGVRMHGIEEIHLLDLYEKLTSAKLSGDGWPHTLCYMCSSQLQRCARFADTAHRAEKFLKDLHLNGMEVTHETVAALKISVAQDLSLVTLTSTSFNGYAIDDSTQEIYEVVVKVEDTSEDLPKLERSSSEHNPIEIKIEGICTTPTENYRCDVCDKASMTETELSAHLRIHNSAADNAKSEIKKDTQCKVCNKDFSDPKALKLHESVHTGAKPFVCNQCGDAFRLKQSLQNHVIVQHSGERRFVCDVCNKSFFHRKGLTAHKQSPKCHSPTYRPYTCRKCDCTFMEVDALKQHKRTHVGERRYGCNKCDKTFTVKRYLTRHYSQVHGTETRYDCHRCFKTFKKGSSLKTHMKIHTKEQLHSCKLCGLKFLYKSSLKRHSVRHASGGEVTGSDEWPYCCDRCSKKFKSRTGLKAHLRTHTGEQPFCCDTCGKKFNQKGNLLLHMKIHFGEKSFACEVCGKTFLLKCQLKIHYQVHMAVKPYACNRCEMKFTFKCAYQQHLKRRHAEVKAFACSKCGKSFDLESNLSSHVRRHEAERIYSCEQCSKRYTSADKLKRHVAIHSEETPYACHRCNKSFKILRYLQQHETSARCRANAAASATQLQPTTEQTF